METKTTGLLKHHSNLISIITVLIKLALMMQELVTSSHWKIIGKCFFDCISIKFK